MFDGVCFEPTLFLITPDTMDRWLPLIGGFLARMAGGSGGRYYPEDIEEGVRMGSMRLFLIIEGPRISATIAVEIRDYPRLRVCRFIGAVGTGLRRWIYLHDHIRSWARGEGCERMEAMTAREGWAAVLTHTFGYRRWHLLLEGDV